MSVTHHSFKQQLEVFNALKARQRQIEEGLFTQEQLGKELTEKLGFPVSASQISRISREGGVAWKNGMNTGSKRRIKRIEDAIRMLAECSAISADERSLILHELNGGN